MARPPKLDEAAISDRLATLGQWSRVEDSIQKEWKAADFVSAVGFINAVAVLAETADHHPDIRLHSWNRVLISLSTHDQGGLTHLDFDLAQKIDAIQF